MQLADLISFLAEIDPEKPAVIAGDRVVTFSLLEVGVCTVMARIARLNLPSGALVGLAIENPLRHLAVSLALARLGMSSVPLQREGDLAILPRLICVLSEKPGGDPSVVVHVGDDWFAATDASSDPRPTESPRPDALCRVVMSSGSTGAPKALAVSFAAMQARVDGVGRAMDIAGSSTRTLTLMDLPSAWGYTVATAALSRGRTICFAGSTRDALRMISLYGIDYLICSAHQLRSLVQHQDEAFVALPSLEAISVGGAPASPELIAATQARLTTRVLTMYGSAELGACAFEIVGVRAKAPGDTGVLAPWVEFEVLGDDGRPLPPGGVGELRLRGNSFAPPLGADGSFTADAGTWFDPGDIASVSATRRLNIVGRSREILNIGGAKIAPEAVEALMMEFPGIRDAGVASRRRQDGLTEVVAAIVCTTMPDEKALRDFIAGRWPVFAPAMVKRVVAIPRGETGKIRRRELDALLQ